MGVMKSCWWMVLVMVTVFSKLKHFADGDPQVKCYFIFGDSLADTGNNNYLRTVAKANYTPYGIDFPGGATGRFSNGRTIFDIIAEFLGFANYIPIFASVNGSEFFVGVNYASGSAGIREETGKQMGDRISFDMQLQNHEEIIKRMVDVVGDKDSTTLHLSKCLYSVGFGNNDFLNNYFLPEYYPTSQQYTLDQFTMLLIGQYTQQLKTLYELGARKIAVFGTGVLGCIPYSIFAFGNGTGCADHINAASQLFNSRLIPVIDQLNAEFSDAKFTYINSFGIGEDSHVLDFKDSYTACCPVGEDGQCIADQVPCQNRTEYAFWDAFHPTEAVNIFTATRSFFASKASDAYPFDISGLVLEDAEGTAMAM